MSETETLNYSQHFYGTINGTALDSNLVILDKFYFIISGDNIKRVEGKNLKSVLNSEFNNLLGIVKGYYDEKNLRINIVDNFLNKNEKGRESYVDELPKGRFNLRLEYNNGFSTKHLNLNNIQVIDKLLNDHCDADNAYVQFLGESN